MEGEAGEMDVGCVQVVPYDPQQYQFAYDVTHEAADDKKAEDLILGVNIAYSKDNDGWASRTRQNIALNLSNNERPTLDYANAKNREDESGVDHSRASSGRSREVRYQHRRSIAYSWMAFGSDRSSRCMHD